MTESSLAGVDHTVPPDVACLLACCIMTGVGAVVHGAAIGPNDTVAVIGCGGVGVSAIQGARLAGARRIIAIDALTGKLDAAKRFGAPLPAFDVRPGPAARRARPSIPPPVNGVIKQVAVDHGRLFKTRREGPA